ncbi:hypothetical protein K438DRAFT_1752990 [Mycena galopus ATCC 62051]|nr:hypothetical protein K438DRAFT_1752990 [Mycena galopus ATCC 62051]
MGSIGDNGGDRGGGYTLNSVRQPPSNMLDRILICASPPWKNSKTIIKFLRAALDASNASSPYITYRIKKIKAPNISSVFHGQAPQLPQQNRTLPNLCLLNSQSQRLNETPFGNEGASYQGDFRLLRPPRSVPARTRSRAKNQGIEPPPEDADEDKDGDAAAEETYSRYAPTRSVPAQTRSCAKKNQDGDEDKDGDAAAKGTGRHAPTRSVFARTGSRPKGVALFPEDADEEEDEEDGQADAANETGGPADTPAITAREPQGTDPVAASETSGAPAGTSSETTQRRGTGEVAPRSKPKLRTKQVASPSKDPFDLSGRRGARESTTRPVPVNDDSSTRDQFIKELEVTDARYHEGLVNFQADLRADSQRLRKEIDAMRADSNTLTSNSQKFSDSDSMCYQEIEPTRSRSRSRSPSPPRTHASSPPPRSHSPTPQQTHPSSPTARGRSPSPPQNHPSSPPTSLVCQIGGSMLQSLPRSCSRVRRSPSPWRAESATAEGGHGRRITRNGGKPVTMPSSHLVPPLSPNVIEESDLDHSSNDYGAEAERHNRLRQQAAKNGDHLKPTIEEEDEEDEEEFEQEAAVENEGAGAKKATGTKGKGKGKARGRKDKGKGKERAVQKETIADELDADEDDEDDVEGGHTRGPIPAEIRKRLVALEAEFMQGVEDLAVECGKSSSTLHCALGTSVKAVRASSAWNVWESYFAEEGPDAEEKKKMNKGEFAKLAREEFYKACKIDDDFTKEMCSDSEAVFERLPFLLEWKKKIQTHAILDLQKNGNFKTTLQRETLPLTQLGFVIDPQGDGSFAFGGDDDFKELRKMQHFNLNQQIKDQEHIFGLIDMRKRGLAPLIAPPNLGAQDNEKVRDTSRRQLTAILVKQLCKVLMPDADVVLTRFPGLRCYEAGILSGKDLELAGFQMKWGPKFIDSARLSQCCIMNYPAALNKIHQVIGTTTFDMKKIKSVDFAAFMPALVAANAGKDGADEDDEDNDVMAIMPWTDAEKELALDEQGEVGVVIDVHGKILVAVKHSDVYHKEVKKVAQKEERARQKRKKHNGATQHRDDRAKHNEKGSGSAPGSSRYHDGENRYRGRSEGSERRRSRSRSPGHSRWRHRSRSRLRPRGNGPSHHRSRSRSPGDGPSRHRSGSRSPGDGPLRHRSGSRSCSRGHGPSRHRSRSHSPGYGCSRPCNRSRSPRHHARSPHPRLDQPARPGNIRSPRRERDQPHAESSRSIAPPRDDGHEHRPERARNSSQDSRAIALASRGGVDNAKRKELHDGHAEDADREVKRRREEKTQPLAMRFIVQDKAGIIFYAKGWKPVTQTTHADRYTYVYHVSKAQWMRLPMGNTPILASPADEERYNKERDIWALLN